MCGATVRQRRAVADERVRQHQPQLARCYGSNMTGTGKGTVIFGGYRYSLANQMMMASHALHQACLAGKNFAGYYYPGCGSGAPMRDITELFHLPTMHRRLRGEGDMQLGEGVCPRDVDARGRLRTDRSKTNCLHTRAVPVSCVTSRGALNDTVLCPTCVEAEANHSLLPKRMHLLYAMEPSRYRLWQPTSCNFHPEKAKYNAVHFDVDADWLMFICSPLATYRRFMNGGMSRAEQVVRFKPGGPYTTFVRRVVIPQFIRAMRATFEDTSLPLFVCTSLGKLTDTTLWIMEELDSAVRVAFGTDVILGSVGNTARELNALGELRVLIGAHSALLWPGSSFSELAAATLAMRNASVAWAPDMRSSHLCFKTKAQRLAHYGMGVENKSNSWSEASEKFRTKTGTQLLGIDPKPLRTVSGRDALCHSTLAVR